MFQLGLKGVVGRGSGGGAGGRRRGKKRYLYEKEKYEVGRKGKLCVQV